MGGVVTKEEAIARAQYLDLVYSQSGTLYELIPNATHATTDPSKPSSTSDVDGFIGSVKTQSTSQSTGTTQRSASMSTPSSTTPSSTSPQTQVSEVNTVQSTPSQQSGGKKKERNKPKKNNNNEQPKNQPQIPAAGKQPQWKPKFPCLICGDDHYNRDYPHRNEVAKFFKGIHNPLCLPNLFHSNNIWLLKPPLQGAVPTNPMMRPRQVPTFTCLTGLI
jgi:hypothetical protein